MHDQIHIERLNNFDLLRFLAAVVVILFHSLVITAGNENSDWIYWLTGGVMTSGIMAVDAFFIISGFLIAKSWDKSKSAYDFLRKRFLRIFPGLAVVLLLSAFVMGPLATSLSLRDYFVHPGPYVYLLSIFLHPIYYFLPEVFTRNPHAGMINGSLWTLEYEVVCYLTLFILGMFGLLKKNFILIVLAVLYLLPTKGLMGWWINTIVLARFFMTSAAFYLWRDKIKYTTFGVVVSLIMIFLGLVYPYYIYYFLPIFGTYLLLAAAFSTRIKGHDFGKYGDFSYGLYIYSYPIQQLLTQISQNRLTMIPHFIISLVLSLGCAYLSWNFVENRFLHHRRRTA